ncbi:MAG: metallophosphoesterase [Deltaproteobacteria bacterium]|jgi:predicted MPP superfamily phosphohydrolase|nr:metallophosphoesterase [Deltaproteobacteria bacterium]
MFLGIMLILVVSALYDPYLLARKMIGTKKKVWPLQLLALFLLLGYFAVVATGFNTRPSLIAAFLFDFLGLFFIFYVYLFFCLRVVQIVWLAGWLLSSAKRKKGERTFFTGSFGGGKAAVGGLALCLLLVLYGAIHARSFEVTEYEIALHGITGEVKLMHLPDLHLGPARGAAYLESVLEVVKAQKPDIIWYNGDMVDGRIALRDEIFDQFKELDGEQYFTTGNHEHYVGVDDVVKAVAAAGIRVLRSELVETHGIQFVGMEYMNADRTSTDSHQVNRLNMEEELPRVAKRDGPPVVLVHHSPVGMKYVAQYGARAMLAGHTHGGQVFPGTVIIKSRFPMYKGRYETDGMTLLVSQGVGTFGPMIRLGTSNELQVVRFVPAGPSGQ